MVGFGSSAAKSTTRSIVVGVGDMAIAAESEVTLSTFGLGSCVGVVMCDPVNKVGGILHVMLPSSSVAVQKAKAQPYLFADTGVTKFLSMLDSMGADFAHSMCVVAGGASVMASGDTFKIGQQNAEAVLAKLSEHGVIPAHQFLGGFSNRSLHLNTGNCLLQIALPNEKQEVSFS